MLRSIIAGTALLAPRFAVRFPTCAASVLALAVVFTACPFALSGAYTVERDIAYKTIAGVDPNLLSLDIYTPDPAPASPAPVVIWVHGGGWRAGDKANQMRFKPPLFADAGYLLVSVNYRLSPSGPDLDPDRVMHPVHARDVASAVAWVRENIGAYGGDPARLALMGHSAGAHLVAIVSTDESLLGIHGLGLNALRGTICLDTDTYDIPAMMSERPGQGLLYINAFGSEEAQWREASPITHVESGKDIPPFLLVRRGAPGRLARCADFASALKAAGTTAQVVTASGYSHSEVNQAVGFPGERVVTPPLMAFLKNVFNPAP